MPRPYINAHAPLLTFDEALADDSFVSGGAFNDSDADVDGIGAGSTTTGLWVSLVRDAVLLVQGSLLFDLSAAHVVGGIGSDGVEIASVATNPVTFMNRDSVAGAIAVDPTDMLDVSLRVGASTHYLHFNMKLTSRGKGSGLWLPIIHQWSRTRQQTIVDGLVVADSHLLGGFDWDGHDMNPFQMRDPNAGTLPDVLRNVALLSSFQEVGLPNIRIGFVGDSLMNKGGFPDWLWSSRPDQVPGWIPLYGSNIDAAINLGPKGYDGSGGAAAESANGLHFDAGCLTTIIREMHKRGFVSSSNLNFTRGGATTAQIATDLASLVAVDIPSVLPLVIFMNAGQNEANDGASFNATTYETNIKAALTTAHGASVSQVILTNLHSMQNNQTLYADDVFKTNVDTCNAIIEVLPAWAVSSLGADDDFVRVADNFNAFGGHNYTAGLQLDDDVHHSTWGSWLFGNTMAEKVTSLALGERNSSASRAAV